MKVIIVLPVLGIVLLYLGLLKSRKFLLPVAVTGLVFAGILSLTDWGTNSRHYNDMIFTDNYAVAFSASMILITCFIFLLSNQYYKDVEFHVAEILSLMLFALTGAVLMVSFSNIAMLFIGIETLSISLYILAGSKKFSIISNEASFKYYLTGSFASAVFLLGVALIYGSSASFNILKIAEYVKAGIVAPVFYVGISLIIIGMAFKVAAIPFHFWTPDVYEGSPTLITLFMATVVKTASFAAFLRLFSGCFSEISHYWQLTIWIITALTLLISNLAALRQKSIKRMMAYSGISHTGFLMLSILALNSLSAPSVLFYTFTYSLATTGVFAILIVVKNARKDEGIVDSFAGLNKANHFLSLVMVVSLVSLTGIPVTAGFFAKYFMFVNALKSHFVWIVIIAVVSALISIYYYFRIIIAIYAREAEQPEMKTDIPFKTTLILCLALIIILGLFPGLGILEI
jgi:NADH-quinone oxidoreductase subunit N